MMKPTDEHGEWLPVPEHVAALAGRITFYAAWLDDVCGEAVVLGNPDATHTSESTPGWADSGKALVAAVRAIPVDPVSGLLANRLDRLNGFRNQLVHGVWMYSGDSVQILKRSRDKGERTFDDSTYSFSDLESLIAEYQAVGKLADRFVSLLMRRYDDNDDKEPRP